MATAPHDPAQGAAAGCSLGEDVAAYLALGLRIGARLEAREHDAIDGSWLAPLAASLLRGAGLGEAGAAVLARAAHVGGDLKEAGYFTVRSFLLDAAQVAGGRATGVQKLGAGLERCPRLRLAVLSGRATPDAARVAGEGIEAAVTDLRGSARDEARAKGEEIVLPVCQVGTVADVEKTVASLLFHLDPESAARRALEAMERCEVRFGRVGEKTIVAMVLDAVTGAEFKALLDARVDAVFRTGAVPEDLRETGDEAEDDRRRALARPRMYAEVFTELVREILDRGMTGTRHGHAPHLTLVVSEDVHATGGPGELIVAGQDPVLIPAQTVERILCDADVTEVHVEAFHADVPQVTTLEQMARHDGRVRLAAALTDPHDLSGACGHVHCVGRRNRTATRTQRQALLVRDRHCRFPGCRVDPDRCEAHHVKEWDRDHGSTCLSNLVLLCRRHHALLHAGRWQLAIDTGLDPGHPAYWQFVPPATGYLGRDGALLAERLRRGHPRSHRNHHRTTTPPDPSTTADDPTPGTVLGTPACPSRRGGPPVLPPVLLSSPYSPVMSYGWREIAGEKVELCDECGFDARLVTDQAAAVAEAIAALDALTDRPEAGRRPDADTFSAEEYAAHSLEITLALLGHIARVTGRPSPADAPDLPACSTLVLDVLSGLTERDRAAVLSGHYPFDVTVDWLVLHLLHDVEHHVLDVRRGYARIAMADHPTVYTVER